MNDAPYPGLRPFTDEESNIFFGREEQTDELLRRLNRHRFLAVVGESGCGKSSLVRAGLIAAIESGFMVNAGARWRVATLRPGSRPIERLHAALLESGLLKDDQDEATIGFLRSALNRGPSGLINALKENAFPEDTNFLLLVDQFEELFRISRAEDRDQADAFVEMLLESVKQTEVPIYVVMTMRSDFLGDTALFGGLPEAVNDGIYLTPRLTREQRQSCIESPARVFGGDVTADLVNKLLNEMAADRTKLPLMQHLLMRMWAAAAPTAGSPGSSSDLSTDGPERADTPPGRVLTLQQYEDAGGLSHALNDHAEEIYLSLDEVQQQIAKLMFTSLCERTTDGETARNLRRPTSVAEITEIANASPAVGEVRADDVIEVAGRFRAQSCNFITPPAAEPVYPNTVLDISHESLMLSWERLIAWMDQRGRLTELMEEMVKPASQWHGDTGDGPPWYRFSELYMFGGRYHRARYWRKNTDNSWALFRPGDYDLVRRFVSAGRRSRYLTLLAAVSVAASVAVVGWQFHDYRVKERIYTTVGSLGNKMIALDAAISGIRSDLECSVAREAIVPAIKADALIQHHEDTFEAMNRCAENTDATSDEISACVRETLEGDESSWGKTSGTILQNDCSKRLQELVVAQERGGLVQAGGDKTSAVLEIFVTDKYGFNVCMSQQTSDYVQSDEDWWRGVYSGGSSPNRESRITIVDKVDFDDSAQAWGVPVYLDVQDSGRNFVGAAKVVFDLQSLVGDYEPICSR